jgi:hypothetical protein
MVRGPSAWLGLLLAATLACSESARRAATSAGAAPGPSQPAPPEPPEPSEPSEPPAFACPSLPGAPAAPASTTWLGASNRSGCCEYLGLATALAGDWLPSSDCVQDLAPGLQRGPRRPRIITLEGRDHELELTFEPGQTQLSEAQATELSRYAARIAERQMPPPQLTPLQPSKASARQLAVLVQRVLGGLTQAHVTGVEQLPPVASSALRVRLRTYSPRAPEPRACRSGATLRAFVPTLPRLVRVEGCHNDACSSGRAELGSAASFVFRLTGPLEAAAYAAPRAGGLLVEVRAGFRSALRARDIYRLKVWVDGASAPLIDGALPAAYVRELIGDRECNDASLSFSP